MALREFIEGKIIENLSYQDFIDMLREDVDVTDGDAITELININNENTDPEKVAKDIIASLSKNEKFLKEITELVILVSEGYDE